MNMTVNFISDGLRLTASQFAQILLDCTQRTTIAQDAYALGGVVEEAEEKFASLLGKQKAVFMPTGTMANHIALRTLAGAQGKVIVQGDSHIYRDIGDSAQTLSGLNLIPLGRGRVGFTLEEVQQTVSSLAAERVATQVKVISIESPVRRHDDAMFDYEAIQGITGFAREHEIRTHLDGARLFVEAAHRDLEPAQIASHFDTVFVSLSKCFNSASGAILAGPADLMEGLYHTRRMFGGSLPQAWPQAAVALHYADAFLPAYRTAWQAADELFQLLDEEDGFRVERIADGTHIVRLHVAGVDPGQFVDRLREHHVDLAPAVEGEGWLTLKVNPSMNDSTVQDLAKAFRSAAQ